MCLIDILHIANSHAFEPLISFLVTYRDMNDSGLIRHLLLYFAFFVFHQLINCLFFQTFFISEMIKIENLQKYHIVQRGGNRKQRQSQVFTQTSCHHLTKLHLFHSPNPEAYPMAFSRKNYIEQVGFCSNLIYERKVLLALIAVDKGSRQHFNSSNV